MKITEIDTNNITNEIIKDVLFTTPNINYKKADFMIIFGCHIKELLEERVFHAIKILKEKEVDKILISGGIGVNGDFNESYLMREILLKNNVNENKLIVEDKSTTTEENIINSLEILNSSYSLNNKTIVLLSNEPHLRRINMELKKQLKDVNVNFVYEYPKESIFSYEKIINDQSLRILAANEINKIISFIELGIIDDEKIN